MDAWREGILRRLRGRVRPEFFETWCRALSLEQAGPSAFQVAVPGVYYREFLDRELTPPLTEVLRETGVADPRVEYVIRKELPPVRKEAVPGPPSQVGYAEGNFARLPFSLVNDKEISVAREILIDQTVRTPKEERRRVWRVTSGVSGMPGPFDHAVFRALEKYALDTTIRKGIPLKNPIFFHLKTVIEILKLYYNTQNVGYVSRALKRLQEISIEDLGVYHVRNERKRGVSRKMHLLDAVKAAGHVLSNGAVYGTHAVFFGQEYLDSVNARYVRPLDWDLWLGLKRPISRRLVEILDTDFYGLRNSRHVAYSYGELCQLIPVRPQKYVSKGRGVLDPAHRELAEQGYLDFSWDLSDRAFPRILYVPGERWRTFQHRLGHGAPVSDEARNLARELGEPDRGTFYQQVLDRADSQYVNEALKDLRSRVLEGRSPDNSAAWFLGALKAILSSRGLSLF